MKLTFNTSTFILKFLGVYRVVLTGNLYAQDDVKKHNQTRDSKNMPLKSIFTLNAE